MNFFIKSFYFIYLKYFFDVFYIYWRGIQSFTEHY